MTTARGRNWVANDCSVRGRAERAPNHSTSPPRRGWKPPALWVGGFLHGRESR